MTWFDEARYEDTVEPVGFDFPRTEIRRLNSLDVKLGSFRSCLVYVILVTCETLYNALLETESYVELTGLLLTVAGLFTVVGGLFTAVGGLALGSVAGGFLATGFEKPVYTISVAAAAVVVMVRLWVRCGLFEVWLPGN